MIDYCGSGISQCWAVLSGLESLHLPSCKTKEPGVSDSCQWASGKGELTCLKQSPEAAPHQLRQTGQDSLCFMEKGSYLYGELDSCWLIGYQGN